MSEYRPPPGTPRTQGPGSQFGTPRPSPFRCLTPSTPLTRPPSSHMTTTPLPSGMGFTSAIPDPSARTFMTPVHGTPAKRPCVFGTGIPGTPVRPTSSNSNPTTPAGPGTPPGMRMSSNLTSLTPCLGSGRTFATRLPDTPVRLTWRNSKPVTPAGPGTPPGMRMSSNLTSMTPCLGSGTPRAPNNLEAISARIGSGTPNVPSDRMSVIPCLGSGTPPRVPSDLTSVTPCLGSGTPRLQTSSSRSTKTPGTPYSRPSRTPGTPFFRPATATHGTTMTPLQQVQRSPVRTPVPPTPTSSFSLSVREASSSDEDMDSHENIRFHAKSQEVAAAQTGSIDPHPRGVDEIDEALIERMDIGVDGDERMRTPSPQGSSGSSGLYSPLPCSTYGDSSPERIEPCDNDNEDSVPVSPSCSDKENQRSFSPSRTHFPNSSARQTSPSSRNSIPAMGPFVSTPLNAGAQTNFQSWLAARGNRESVISYIRNIPTPSAAARAAQVPSTWSTPARPPTTVATSAPGTVIGSYHGSINEDDLRRRRQVLEGIEDDDFEFKDSVLSVVWAGGKLGAAYYCVESSELFLFPEVTESAPDFTILKTLYKQVRPRYIVASSRQDERFLKLLKDIAGENITGEDGPDQDGQTDPEIRPDYDGPQLFVQTGREFAPDACRNRLQALKLPDEPKTHDSKEHLLYITSLIPFSSEIMVRAAGALLKFLDKSCIELLRLDLVDGLVPVLNVNICSMDDLVMVDETAWNSLHIFTVDFHPSSTKQGAWGGSKEGLSVFNLLNRCYSAQGTRALKLQLLRPTRNMKLLERRYDIIEYCVNPARTEFIRAAGSCLKAIKSIPKLLFKLSMLHTTVREWKDLYQTVYHCLLLGELASSQPGDIAVFKDIAAACKSEVLRSTSQEMMRVIDFEESALKGQFVAKHGIDPELDKKRQEYSHLPEVMSMVAAEEMNSLPDFVQQCSVVYIPEVGYLLAISSWEEELTLEDLQLEGLDYKFTDQDLNYYKSSRMNELDIILGDCQVAIMDLEACIMIYLTETILSNSTKLLKINALVSELDSLLALASVAREHNYIRPKIVPGHKKLEIIGGRHPLVEQICDFVPNSTIFNEEEKIVILTGPNASGKSIYLKQVGVLVIMALSGSFIPATSATIPTVDMICTRIHAKESVSTGLSTFLIDVNQMSLALRSATKSSLVIIDEFGKGTAEADGLSLLIATVDDFASRGADSPMIFISTHYYSLMDHLEYSPLLKPQTMEFMRDGNVIVYLFKLQSGSCRSSFAHLIAENTGISESTVSRSTAIEELVRRQLGEESIDPIPGVNKEMEDLMINLADEFLNLNLDDIDPVGYMERICSLLDPFMPDSKSPLVKTAQEAQDERRPEIHTSNSSSTGSTVPVTVTHSVSHAPDSSHPGTFELSHVAHASHPGQGGYHAAVSSADQTSHPGTYEVSHIAETSYAGAYGVSHAASSSGSGTYEASHDSESPITGTYEVPQTVRTITSVPDTYGVSTHRSDTSSSIDSDPISEIYRASNPVNTSYPVDYSISRSETHFPVDPMLRFREDLQVIPENLMESEPLF